MTLYRYFNLKNTQDMIFNAKLHITQEQTKQKKVDFMSNGIEVIQLYFN